MEKIRDRKGKAVQKNVESVQKESGVESGIIKRQYHTSLDDILGEYDGNYRGHEIDWGIPEGKEEW